MSIGVDLIDQVNHAVNSGNWRDQDIVWKKVEEARRTNQISDYAHGVFRKRIEAAGYFKCSGKKQ